jgi:hypothetical protein
MAGYVMAGLDPAAPSRTGVATDGRAKPVTLGHGGRKDQ